MTRALVTRRMLLKDMGRAGMAVIILGGAACSEEPTDEITPTGESGSTSTSDRPTSTPGELPHEWHRVNLGFVSAYILYREGEAAIVDTGVEGSESDIEAGLSEIGLGWDSVSVLIITHKHPDHQGSVAAALERISAGSVVVAGSADMSSIATDRAITPAFDGHSYDNLQIIETPGHTPGHISVLDPATGVLVAGDALNGADGGVAGPNPGFSEDMDLANASVAKLAEFDYEVALFGHGEPVLEGASGQVAELADSLNAG